MVLCEIRYNERMDRKSRGERLRRYREEAKLSREQIGELIGVGEKAVGHYETGTNDINVEQLQILADYYHVTMDELVGRETPLPEFTVQEEEPPYESYPVGPFITIPVFGVIRAGKPMLARQEIIDYETVDSDDYEKGDFYLKVTGDSMEPDHIPDGTRVLVRPEPEVQPTDIAVIIVDGDDATLARAQLADDKVILMKSNPRYPAQVYPAAEVRIIGRVVAWKIKPEYLHGA